MAREARGSRRGDHSNLRLDEDLEARVTDLAERRGMEPGELIEAALSRYVEFDHLRNRFGMMNFYQTIGPKITDYATDGTVRELGRWAAEGVIRPFMLFWFGKEDIETAISSLCVLRSCAKIFEVEHNRSYSTWLIVVKHELGPKWSAFYEEMMQTLFGQIPRVESVRSQISNKQVTMEVIVSRPPPPKVGSTERTELESENEQQRTAKTGQSH